MIVGGDYFEGSHDHNLMTGSLTHDSSLAPKCNDNTNIELQRFKVQSFSADILSDSTNLSSEAARAINHLQHQLGIGLEQDMPPVETATWDTSISRANAPPSVPMRQICSARLVQCPEHLAGTTPSPQRQSPGHGPQANCSHAGTARDVMPSVALCARPESDQGTEHFQTAIIFLQTTTFYR
uniref:Uncharacterized protein n=1 Tax=Aegilops tauschii subsp. strangulata TaxID=200361 RepID=A0A453CVK3_AEGTS